MKNIFSIVYLFIIINICFSFSQPIQESKSVKSGNFIFSWKIENENLICTLSCETKGWLAVGFNPKKVMKDANIITGCILDNKPVIVDEFGNDVYSHSPDTVLGGKNNIIKSSFSFDNNIAKMFFCIPLNSGDSKDVELVKGEKITLIFATGNDMNTKKRHSKTSKTTITL
jgi:hypothetical protein